MFYSHFMLHVRITNIILINKFYRGGGGGGLSKIIKSHFMFVRVNKAK